jgi:hypothetical protein
MRPARQRFRKSLSPMIASDFEEGVGVTVAAQIA